MGKKNFVKQQPKVEKTRRAPSPPSSSDESEDAPPHGCGDDACRGECEGGNMILPADETIQLQSIFAFEKANIFPLLHPAGSASSKVAAGVYAKYRELHLRSERLYDGHVSSKREEIVRTSNRKRPRSANPAQAFYAFLASGIMRTVSETLVTSVVREMSVLWQECGGNLENCIKSFFIVAITLDDEKLLASVTNISHKLLFSASSASSEAFEGIEFTFSFAPNSMHTSSSASVQFFFAGSSFHRLGKLRFGRIIDVRATKIAWTNPKLVEKLPRTSFFKIFFGDQGGLKSVLAEGTAAWHEAQKEHEALRAFMRLNIHAPWLVQVDQQVPLYDVRVLADRKDASPAEAPAAVAPAVGPLATLLASISAASAAGSPLLLSRLVVLNAGMQHVCRELLHQLSTVSADTLDQDQAESIIGSDEMMDDEELEEGDEEDDEEDSEEEAVQPQLPPAKGKSKKPSGAGDAAPAPNLKKPECKQQ